MAVARCASAAAAVFCACHSSTQARARRVQEARALGALGGGAAVASVIDPHRALARTESTAKDDAPPLYPTRATMTHFTNFYTAETAPSVMALLTQAFAKFAGETREAASECVTVALPWWWW